MMKYKDKVSHELELIRRKHKGILNPKDVVEFARNSDTALHQEFEWNDKIAGDAYRILQAREVIRTRVTVLTPDTKPVRAYVSLPNDRKSNGGYRRINDVLEKPAWREQLLKNAMADMRAFQTKYAVLKELANVFSAMQEVEARREEQRAHPERFRPMHSHASASATV